MVPSAFVSLGPESTWKFTCDIVRFAPLRASYGHLQRDSCPNRGYQAPTRKTIPVVKRALSVVARTLTRCSPEFQWRTVSSVSTSCSVLLLTCLVQGDEAYHLPNAGERSQGLAQFVNAGRISLWAVSSCGDNSLRQLRRNVVPGDRHLICAWLVEGRERENRKEHGPHDIRKERRCQQLSWHACCRFGNRLCVVSG